MKKKLLFLVAALALFVPSVMAAEKTAGTEEELTKAFSETATGDTIKLTADIDSTNHLPLTDGRKLTINLNGHNLNFTNGKTLFVVSGELTITGKGIVNLNDLYINVWGIEESTSKEKSILNVEKDVTIKGSTGIAIYESEKNAYNTEVNFAGTIIAEDYGITTNGKIKNENGPVVNIKKGSVITATGNDGIAVYCAGNGTYNIEDGVKLTGATGIEVRSGKLNVKGGTITGTAKKLVSEANSKGATTAGAGIAVVQHTTQLPIEVNITGGTITGAEALYVNNTQGNPTTAWAKVNVTVTGGTFNTDVAKFVGDKYVVNKNGSTYAVVENKVLETTDEKVTFESDKALDNDLKLEVTEKNDDEIKKGTEKVTEAYKDNKKVKEVKLINLYEIDVLNGNGRIEKLEDGKFTIAIAIPESDQKYDNYKVVYFDEEGKLVETLNAKLENGKVVFTTSHLSTYGVIGYNNVTETPTETPTETKPEKNPTTSDINLALIISAIVISTIGVVITSKKISAKVTR
ncbi:MAG: hypothetical protein PUH43_06760 [Clostridium sp.]|nr:hypothetical protein [Clostridium sp.]